MAAVLGWAFPGAPVRLGRIQARVGGCRLLRRHVDAGTEALLGCRRGRRPCTGRWCGGVGPVRRRTGSESTEPKATWPRGGNAWHRRRGAETAQGTSFFLV